MNHHYFLKARIKERQHQLLKTAMAIRLANSCYKIDQPAKEPAATLGRAPSFTHNAVVTGGSQV